MKLVAISGPIGSGKTTTMLKLAAALHEQGIVVGGIVQPAVREAPAASIYSLLDLTYNQTHPLAYRPPGHSAVPPYQEFQFYEEAWPWAASRIIAARQHANIVMVDELGRLEASGAGHLPALQVPVSDEKTQVMILGVRQSVLSAMENILGVFDVIWPPTEDDSLIKKYTQHIRQLLQNFTLGNIVN